MSEPVISWSDLEVAYKDREPIVFGSRSLEVGVLNVVTGRSGSGKTTLLSLAAGLLLPSSGTMTVLGCRSEAKTQKQFDSLRRGSVGFIPQIPQLISALSVADNIAIATDRVDSRLVDELASKLGVEHLMNSFPADLSGGEAHRVCAVRALAMNPQIILADEPTAFLDDGWAEKMVELMASQKSRATILVASHSKHFHDVADEVFSLGVAL